VSSARLRLWAKVEYDGTRFYGFQVQARGRTVQGEIEQVIAFEAEWRHELADLHRALNAVLAADVAVLELGLAPEGFHPRFSARSRTYRYTLLNRMWPSPLERRRAWHVAQALDLARMIQASERLVGTHDFAAFGRPPQGENTVRTIVRAEWQEAGPFFTFDLEANAFLYRMVRCIVGTLVQVGGGHLSPEEFSAILESRDRSRIKKVAPAHGLCLMRVDYAMREGELL
jgi:tRNA pseudouridine38-40 synthase